MPEIMKNIDISLLVPFENHPFKERSGTEQEELLESIKESGVLEPITVRFLSEGKYEIISGHRRVDVCKKLGISKIPATIKEFSKDEAIIAMVDYNIHREHLLPSEKAFAYKMKLEALKHQENVLPDNLSESMKAQITYRIRKAADRFSDISA